uniref:Paired box protein Pax-6-like n=1 Tax=Geotrypetes seraphini TaxID=260995 RepID=A0A6P8P1A7_GEOSA|nr:paired box protein Pax-6-like [Geotrypetes seraphini]
MSPVNQPFVDLSYSQQELEMLLSAPVGVKKKRVRTSYEKHQILELEKVFAVDPYPSITTREKLSAVIKLPESKIHVWFQNRRAREGRNGKLDKLKYRRSSATKKTYQGLHLSSATSFPQELGYSPMDPLLSRQCPDPSVQYIPELSLQCASPQPCQSHSCHQGQDPFHPKNLPLPLPICQEAAQCQEFCFSASSNTREPLLPSGGEAERYQAQIAFCYQDNPLESHWVE